METDSNTESPETVTQQVEYFFECSKQTRTTVSINNNTGGKSPILVEIRDGGCQGELKGRVLVEPNDRLSGYETQGDHVRLFATDPGQGIRYAYTVKFESPLNDESEHHCRASGRHRTNVYLYNNSGGDASVHAKLKQDEDPVLDLIVPPTVYSYVYNSGNLLVVKAEEEKRVRASFRIDFQPA